MRVSLSLAFAAATVVACRAETVRVVDATRQRPPAMLVLSSGRPDDWCQATKSLHVTIVNTSAMRLWMRLSRQKTVGRRRLWITAVGKDGREIPDRCSPTTLAPEYESIDVGAARTVPLVTRCFRRAGAGWYAFTAHYRDDHEPLALPANAPDADRWMVETFNGATPPAGAMRVRAQIDSNTVWIYLESADEPDCPTQYPLPT